MATIPKAVSQLDAAIAHLEKALASKGGAKGVDSGQAEAALTEARRRNEELSAVADQVATRLDRAVGRVTALLES